MSLQLTRFSQFIATMLALLAIGTNCQAQSTLKWSGKAGEKLKYSFNQVTEGKRVLQGQPVSNYKSELTLDLAFTIKAVANDGTLDLAFASERARMRIVSAGRILEYDSADLTSSVPSELASFRKVFDAMLNQPYSLKMTQHGEVIDVRVPDAVVGAVGGTQFAVNADYGSFHSAKGVKVTLDQIIPLTPKTPVSTGSTWKSELAIPPTGPPSMTLKYDYFVDSIAANLAKFHSTIATDFTTKGDGQIETKLNKQTGSSSYVFDLGAGRLVESSQNLDRTSRASGSENSQTLAIRSSFKLLK